MGDVELISPDEAHSLISDISLIDVREERERAEGYIEGSQHIPMSSIGEFLRSASDGLTPRTVLYCATGARSRTAAALAIEMGVENVASLDGGFERWKEEDLPWVHDSELTADQIERYSRHLRLPGVGIEGQSDLLAARVVVVGAGGLGSPVCMYLAAAGVGMLGVVDDDTVDRTNLQRQIMHDLDHVARPKTESARERLTSLNPDVKVETHDERLDAGNALKILSDYDLIVDATDNFPTRYLINDASLHLRIPVVHASIYRFEGQVSVFRPYNGPCYRCLFPSPPPPELAASCDIGGVLGVLPGVIGTLQATEALKLILGIGDPLIGKLLLYDALASEVSSVRFARDPNCPACSDEGSPPLLVDYGPACLPA